MTNAGRNLKQIETVRRVYKIKKEKLRSQINQLNDAVNKKKLSISRLQGYADSYAGKCDALALLNSEILKNNEAFYQNLARVIHSEKSDLLKLEKIKGDLIGSFTSYSKKIEGLDQFCEEISRENLALLLKEEDSELSDLSINRACLKIIN